MKDINQIFSHADVKYINDIEWLINSQEYTNAIKMINNRLSEIGKSKTQYAILFKSKLAGFLIDIGEEGNIVSAAENGLKIFEEEVVTFQKYLWIGSIEYNMGNAKSTLFKSNRKNKDFKYIPINFQLLVEAKNHYWRAYKLSYSKYGNIEPEFIINLANTLSSCGRITESLMYYDMVILKFPDFPQANASRAKELLWLKELSGGYTINLFYQAKKGFGIASDSKNIPNWQAFEWKEQAKNLEKILVNLGHDDRKIHKDIKDTEKEKKRHSIYRRYCLDNYLCLSEHSLYCQCIGSRRDDLMICTPYLVLTADYIPFMEKILNRLKSEFSLARLLYFISNSNDKSKWEIFKDEVVFTELYDNENIDTKSEMLRTCFRLCFGILDKIARGICNLFDLADLNEPIQFENFWKPRGSGLSELQKTRWEKINKIENMSLNALYAQATDINSRMGEWSFFKDWRNSLEHNFLVLEEDDIHDDPLNLNTFAENFISVKTAEFREKTLHMLQFTRSGIFNFVFMVRNEAKKDIGKKHGGMKHSFKFKDDPEC